MSQEQGEIIVGMMVLMMVGMMPLGGVFMHGDHLGNGAHISDDLVSAQFETGGAHVHRGGMEKNEHIAPEDAE